MYRLHFLACNKKMNTSSDVFFTILASRLLLAPAALSVCDETGMRVILQLKINKHMLQHAR